MKFAQVIAGRIVYLYSKYNIKKYNLGIFHKDSQPICPCYSNYLWHSTGVVLRAKKIFETNKYTNNKINFMEWPRSGSLEIDKITAKYIKRTFQIKIKYLNIVNKKPHNKKNTYQVRTVGLYDYIRDLFLIYKYVKDSVYEKITSRQKVLLIAHETNINNQPYNHLEKELKIACKKNNLLLITKCSHNFWIKFVQRICFLKTIKFILKETINLKITKLSDFHFIFFYIATKKFEENLSNYYKDNSIISVGTTYIDWLRMDRFYRACKNWH